MSTIIAQNKNVSEQSVGTPWEFIRAVEARFGPIVCDLAADRFNAKCDVCLTEQDDSLSIPWAERFPRGLLYLNPPFNNISLWAAKCAEESKRRLGFITLLVPASIGSVWYGHHVLHQAISIGLSPRMTFEGHTQPYPKDLMLCVYGHGLHGHQTWRWKE